VSPAKTDEVIEILFGARLKEPHSMGVNIIGATWRIQGIEMCSSGNAGCTNIIVETYYPRRHVTLC